MNCQHCGVQAANFHYQANINGQTTEFSLCQDCAEALQGSVFAGQRANASVFFGNRRSGMRPEGFTQRSFAPPVVPEPSEAKIPLEADETLKQRRHVNACRAEMQSAIEAENFERAAELRDELHRLEQSE